jgi:hypothetical protein
MTQTIQNIEPHKYWGLSKSHNDDIREMVTKFYEPLDKFYGNNFINNVLNEVKNQCRGLELLAKFTPALSNTKIGDKEVYSVFEYRTVTLLYEHYLLNVLVNYINLTKDPSMVTKIIQTVELDDIFGSDFLVEQQMRFTEGEQEFIEGDVSKLKMDISKLLVAYLTIMMRHKDLINVSYGDIQDTVFKLKEAEKYSFTDRLKDITEEGVQDKTEAREVDRVLKMYKLGPLYSIGLSKGIKNYDQDNFEHDKQIAEKVAEIRKKLSKNGDLGRDDDFDIEESLNDEINDRDIRLDVATDFNQTDTYDDGDPWGDERDVDDNDYY